MQIKLPASGVGLSPDQVDQLVTLHLNQPLILHGAHTPQVDGDPVRLVTELLRLARIGAVAEAEALIDPGTLNRTVVLALRARWDRLVGVA